MARSADMAASASTRQRSIPGSELLSILLESGQLLGSEMLVVTADPNARQLTRLLLSRAMGLAELTDAEAVRAALAEFDRLGRDRFLRGHGFGRLMTGIMNRPG